MDTENQVRETLLRLAADHDLDVSGGMLLRTSSRFCLGVEHGDYNGTELLGVGTDRFIWLAAKANDSGRVQLVSHNRPDERIEFTPGRVPDAAAVPDSWGRFPYGVDTILRRDGLATSQGFDAVLLGNIPGGGMSRSASLSINLLLTVLQLNGHSVPEGMQVVEWAQRVENDYIGSPCGNLDQIMIYFARAGMGTHYSPMDHSVTYVPFGGDSEDFRLVSLDTGTDRPGLEKSTYKIRVDECDQFAQRLSRDFDVHSLGEVKGAELFEQIRNRYGSEHPEWIKRLRYIHGAVQRFDQMLEAWKAGCIEEVGRLFREDGIGLRDDYEISGPELETLCDIARTVPGVYGERMLGGGDKGAAGAIVAADCVRNLETTVQRAYPLSRPSLADKVAVHSCRLVDGVKELDPL